MRVFYFFTVVLLLTLSSCSGGKAVLREAHTLEQGGLPTKAYEKYEEAYRQYDKAEGLVGMRRIAQAEVNRKFSEAQAQCLRGNYESALQLFEEAFRYAASKSDLEIQAPASAASQQSSCLVDYVNYLYGQAETAFKEERYDEAMLLIRKLRIYDRNNKNAEYLELLSRIYPAYNKGIKAMELGLYREAFQYFDEVSELDAGFRDVMQLREESLKKSKFTIAYIPIRKDKMDDALETSISGAVKQQILELKSPFVELLERERLEQMLQEQMNGMSAAFDERTVIEAGKLTGARYIITGEVIEYEHKVAPQRGYERKAFLGPTVASKKVKYTEYRLGRGLDAAFKFQILDAETGRVYASEIIPFSDRDNVVWSDFEGDYTRLYPGEWKWQLIFSKEDVVNTAEKERLMQEFTGRKGPVSEQEMRSRMMSRFAAKVAEAVGEFRP